MILAACPLVDGKWELVEIETVYFYLKTPKMRTGGAQVSMPRCSWKANIELRDKSSSTQILTCSSTCCRKLRRDNHYTLYLSNLFLIRMGKYNTRFACVATIRLYHNYMEVDQSGTGLTFKMPVICIIRILQAATMAAATKVIRPAP